MSLARIGDGTDRGLPVTQIGAALVVALASALLVVHGGVVPGIAVASGAAVVAALLIIPARYRFGAVIGVAVLGGIDVLPGPDLDTTLVKLGLHAQDLVVIGLFVCLAIDNIRTSFHGLLRNRIGFPIVLATVAIVFWWLVTFYRTSTQVGLSVNHSAYFGRDFLVFALLVPLMCGTLQRKDVRTATLVTLAIGTLYIAVVFSVSALSHRVIAALLHTQLSQETNGILRIFSPASDLFIAALPLAIGAALLGPSRRMRALGALVAVATFVAIVLELTRAAYIDVGFGFVAAVAVWLARSGSASRLALWRLGYTVAGVAATVALAIAFLPHEGKVSHAVNSVTSRFASIGSTATGSNPATSTVAVRLDEASLLEQRLSGHSLLGLGFIDPRDSYDALLPSGSIRNSDVGVLNVTMTMGIVGTILYYIPLVLITGALLVLGRRRWANDIGWLGFGVFAWGIGTLIASATLLTLFSPTGVVVAATMLGLGAAVLLDRPDARTSSDVGTT